MLSLAKEGFPRGPACFRISFWEPHLGIRSPFYTVLKKPRSPEMISKIKHSSLLSGSSLNFTPPTPLSHSARPSPPAAPNHRMTHMYF